ncbi:MAG: PfkB family carbohydrate kinase [Anaerolineae bacterium]
MVIDLVAFGIIIDDIVFADGHTAMGMLGGGGPQTAFGMRLPALAGWMTIPYGVGLVSGVGADLPHAARAWLDATGIDLTGLRTTPFPTARAWQVCESDGRRRQLERVSGEVLGAQLARTLDHLPDAYRVARGFHMGIHPDEPDLEWLAQLRRTGSALPPVISLEPFKPADRPPTDAALRALCRAADIFSPNLEEAQSLVGDAPPEELIRRLAQAGAPIVALRLGPEGSLVHEDNVLVHIPAAPAQVVDPTGAGNAYCGAFLAGYLQTGHIRRAGLYGAVAASFLTEQAGLPLITSELPREANRRLHVLDQS